MCLYVYKGFLYFTCCIIDSFWSKDFLSCFLSSASLASPQQYIILSGRRVFSRGPSQRKISILLRNLRRSNRFSPEGLNHHAQNPLLLLTEKQHSISSTTCTDCQGWQFPFQCKNSPPWRYSNLCNLWHCGFYPHLKLTWDLKSEMIDVISDWTFSDYLFSMHQFKISSQFAKFLHVIGL